MESTTDHRLEIPEAVYVEAIRAAWPQAHPVTHAEGATIPANRAAIEYAYRAGQSAAPKVGIRPVTEEQLEALRTQVENLQEVRAVLMEALIRIAADTHNTVAQMQGQQ